MSDHNKVSVVLEHAINWVIGTCGDCREVDKDESETVSHYVFSNGITLSVVKVYKQDKIVINLLFESLLKSLVIDFKKVFGSGVDITEEQIQFFNNILTEKLISPLAQSSLKESKDMPPGLENPVGKMLADLPPLPFFPAVSESKSAVPSAEQPPKFDDEYQMLGSGTQLPQQPSSSSSQSTPYSIGDRDLNPPGLSKNPAMSSFIDPLAMNSEGGMHPTLNHPLFRNGPSGRFGRGGLGGSPPGARYDDPMMGDGTDDLNMIGRGLPGRGGRRGPGGGAFGGGFNGGGGGAFGSGAGPFGGGGFI